MRTSIRLSVSGFDVAADLERIGGLTETIASTLAQTAVDYGNPAVRLAAREARGTLSMSNNREARELDTLPIVRPGTPHAEAEIVAVPRGAWHLVEYGAAAHSIKPRKRSGKKAMPTPYGIFSRVDHPGTTGTGTWTQAMESAEPVIDEAVREAFAAAMEPNTSGAI